MSKVGWLIGGLRLHQHYVCVIWASDEKPGSAGYGLTLTKPEGTQGIFILHAPIDSHAQYPAFIMQSGSTARGPQNEHS